MASQGSFLQHRLQQGRKVLLVNSCLVWVLGLVGSEDLPPILLERPENGHVQRLQLIRAVGRQAAEGDVVLLARVDHLLVEVAGQVVSEDDLLAREAVGGWQHDLEEPALELETVEPARFGARILSSLGAPRFPSLIHVGRLVDDHGRQHLTVSGPTEHDGRGGLGRVLYFLAVLCPFSKNAFLSARIVFQIRLIIVVDV